ncbi:MAG: SpoIVB peptidase [Thermoflexaceae bacterium]|nr:SpoIVB peptidase [Thermoflexaceae bacterium]
MSAYMKYRIFLYALLLTGMIGLLGFTCYVVASRVPEKIVLKEEDESVLNLGLPFTGEIESQTVSGNYITSVNFNDSVSITTGQPGTYNVRLKLFGVFYYKDITLDVVETKEVYACGIPVGVYLKSEGVLVIDNARFLTMDGQYVNPCENIIKQGDYIVSVNNETISGKNELIDKVMTSEGNPLILGVKRGENYLEVKVNPYKDSSGDYKVGLWVRDDTQGIGTLTYIDENGNFGSLGHGISDIDTGEIFNIHEGVLYRASILYIVKGQSGEPGEYVGTIDYSTKNQIGLIRKNSNKGVFGIINTNPECLGQFEKYEVGYKYDVKPGRAYIISGVDENVKKYEIQIDAVDYSNNNLNKGIEFTVTDQELIGLTNGIVQGMSGSPIIQDGKIIGAVTHVFVNDSRKGYGIFIENMLGE